MDLVLRTIGMFALVFAVTRISGRRTLSSLEPFDFILLVVLGDLIQQAVTQNDQSITGLAIIIATLTLLTVGLQWSTWRSKRLRKILDPEPLVVVENGKVIERNLARERMTTGELLAEARLAQIGSLEEVRWAVLERNGHVSFLKHEDPQPDPGD